MSISPVSDLILDVANAADPAKAQAARQKLAEAAGMDAQAFDKLMMPAAAPQGAAQGWSEEARSRFFSAQTGAPVREAGGMDDAKRGLETLIVKMMVDAMLPRDGSTFFGKGNAGGIWRSMLSDKLADQMTRGPGLGILKDVAIKRGEA